MKKLLVLGNCILAFVLCLSLWGALSSRNEVTLEVGKKRDSKKKEQTAVKESTVEEKIQVPSGKTAAGIITEKNIFDPQRGGGLTFGRGPATYSLVGVYSVGDTKGAIITIKGAPRGRNNTPPQQYFRVGDVLPNGYTLCDVTATQATMARGSSRMVLDMVNASAVYAPKPAAPRAPSAMQQMLDLMRQSVGIQRQQQNMMRNSGTPARGGSTNSRRGRSR